MTGENTTLIGINDMLAPLGESADVQCVVCNLLKEAARTNPDESFTDFCERLVWADVKVCEQHLMEFRMMVEDDKRTDAFMLTVKDVSERQEELLPLAA